MNNQGQHNGNLKNLITKKPIIRSVSRAIFEIKNNNQPFENTIDILVSWMRARSPEIPENAINGEAFSLGSGGHHPAEASRYDEEGYRLWSAILDDPDKDIARRTWVTELTVGQKDGRTAFGARLFNVTRGDDAPFTPSRPRVIRDIIEKLDVEADGVLLSSGIENIKDKNDFNKFWNLLTSTNRTLPIIAFSGQPNIASTTDQICLYTKVSGLAHLVKLSEDMAWELTDRVGKKLSVFDGAIRIYNTNFNPDESYYSDHGLWLQRFTDTEEERNIRLEQITNFIFRSSIRSKQIPDFPRYSEIRRLSDEKCSKDARNKGLSDTDLVKLYEEDIKRLKKELTDQKAEYDELLTEADKKCSDSEKNEHIALQENHNLRQRIEKIENLRRENNNTKDDPLERYDDIESWSDKNLIGSIWISKKALRETRKSNFSDIRLFSNTLLLLRDYYVPMKRYGEQMRYNNYMEELRRMGLEDSRCFSNPNDIRQFPEYKTTYHGCEYWCDNHIKYGSGRDIKNMFRIYYSWHEEDRILLIGHMPTHLDNMMTD